MKRSSLWNARRFEMLNRMIIIFKKIKAGRAIITLIVGPMIALFSLSAVAASEGKKIPVPCDVQHPFKKPTKVATHLRCENCGMNRNIWARTRHVFKNSEGEHYTCSIHCVADMSVRSDEFPENVRVAVYLSPDKMILEAQAYYVVGSKAPGTMTMVSKPAFVGKADAEGFAAQCGGKAVPFQQALAAATKALTNARKMIFAKRQKRGKIAMPDAQTHCAVCGMYPARYPENRAQAISMDKKRYHYCSTRCLFEALAEGRVKPMTLWVTLRNSGRYDYAGSAYYVVGSRKNGPMGPEAFAFETKQAAVAFAQKNGGQVLRFKEVTFNKIMGNRQ
jgi:nitrous oxide reductase accessory protein NosL